MVAEAVTVWAVITRIGYPQSHSQCRNGFDIIHNCGKIAPFGQIVEAELSDGNKVGVSTVFGTISPCIGAFCCLGSSTEHLTFMIPCNTRTIGFSVSVEERYLKTVVYTLTHVYRH